MNSERVSWSTSHKIMQSVYRESPSTNQMHRYDPLYCLLQCILGADALESYVIHAYLFTFFPSFAPLKTKKIEYEVSATASIQLFELLLLWIQSTLWGNGLTGYEKLPSWFLTLRLSLCTLMWLWSLFLQLTVQNFMLRSEVKSRRRWGREFIPLSRSAWVCFQDLSLSL